MRMLINDEEDEEDDEDEDEDEDDDEDDEDEEGEDEDENEDDDHPLPAGNLLPGSKTKAFCETSFKNGKLNAELTASYQCVLRCFDSICLKYCACHEKVMPGHTKCCTCHAKSSSQT